MNKTLVIWFKNGNTAYFERVTGFNETCSGPELVIRFNYFGVASQVERNANFNKNTIAGFALED